MVDHTARCHHEQYLGQLLEYLASPLDNSLSLTASRTPESKVVALKSKEGQYPVIDAIPRMIPDLGQIREGDLATWQDQLDLTLENVRNGGESFFTAEDAHMGRSVGEIIAETGEGLFLDVGCGTLPLPGYMATSSDAVTWMGIDPIVGEAPRQFPFVQALGEYIPFRPKVFDGLLYAWTIDHLADPLRSLRRAFSIIKPHGTLYVWYGWSRVDLNYVVWRIMRMFGSARHYNEYFQWGFTPRSLRALLKRAGFTVERDILLCERCPEYGTCDEPGESLVIARLS